MSKLKLIQLSIICVLFGSMLAFYCTRASAQGLLDTRVTINEMMLHTTEAELERLRTEVAENARMIADLRSDISSIKGIGLGLTSALVLLQIISIVMARSRREQE